MNVLPFCPNDPPLHVSVPLAPVHVCVYVANGIEYHVIDVPFGVNHGVHPGRLRQPVACCANVDPSHRRPRRLVSINILNQCFLILFILNVKVRFCFCIDVDS